MKMAIASKGKDLSSEVDERFGRADFFLITDKNGEIIDEVIKNESKNNTTGAGTNAASLIAEKNVSLLIAGNLGPKAEAVINAAGIKFMSFAGKIRDALVFVKEKGLNSLKVQSSDELGNYQFGRGMGAGAGRGRCINRRRRTPMGPGCRFGGGNGYGQGGRGRF
ncbi:MAG: hypothetical protein CSA18_00860 [Deltaproteobacteria bacterium]|nr:MAG: hypothetical protein CSA18_00860 [Deltaproteobacteria bacterium]